MSISLIGIIIVQFFWVKQAIAVKETQFDYSVNQALSRIVEKVETVDAARFFTSRINLTSVDSLRDILIEHQHNTIIDLKKTDSLFNNIFFVSYEEMATSEIDEDTDIDTENVIWNIKANIKLEPIRTIISYDGDETIHIISEDLEFLEKESFELKTLEQKLILKQRIKNREDEAKIFERKVKIELKKQALIEYRLKNLGQTVKKIAYEYAYADDYFIEHLNTIDLDAIIHDELLKKNIPLEFNYAVIDSSTDTIYRLHSENYKKEIINSKYYINLHPRDIREKNNFLVLDFPRQHAHIFNSIFLLLGGSISFTIIIILIFSYTIYIIIRQKKISEIKSDFINNMTHEFKTPIATISLAVDSINNPNVIGKKEQIKYYLKIIKEENSRMNAQVENVLQMSLIDKKDLELNLAYFNLHDLINRSLKNISLHIEKRKGTIKTEFLAQNITFKVDEIHFTNVINNLLDNAIKYTKGAPEITLTTINSKNGIQILVEDKGIGMSTDAQNKIFDKFYRVPTGNVHNIKGFGLGLSYVKAILEAFDGSIDLVSELDAGSKFTIFLPYKKD